MKDKVAIFTGRTDRIGKAYALAFACEDARIVIADINVMSAQTLRNY